MRQQLVLLSVLLLTSINQLFAQAHPPKREYRAAWIATVANIDWPSKPGLSSDQQRQEFINMLDMLQAEGMNAVIVQVRPSADAFYPSPFEPWSYWLSGKQGVPPYPYYDPLQFMIEETHKRGMEFQAWINPYRAVFNTRTTKLSPESPVNRHPNWFVTYGDRRYFDPGNPAVWLFLTDVVKDIVQRYDVDGIHFDDYFYPYRIRGKEFPDYNSYRQYGNGEPLDVWRRHNIDTMIEMVSKAIKTEKPWVKFGVSPFGVWRNNDRDPEGSNTKAGQTDYDDLYADILLWLRKGWIDYVTPQLYWRFGHPLVGYEVLLDWWANHTYGRDLYIGQGLYRIGSNSNWRNPAEMPNEVKANRTYPQVEGSVYFSASIFNRNTLGFDDSLRNHLYKYPALLPPMKWIDSIPPVAPQFTSAAKVPDGLQLYWRNMDTSQLVRSYVLYRFPGDSIGDMKDPRNIMKIIPAQPYLYYTDSTRDDSLRYTYVITALDRLWNESQPSMPLRADVIHNNNVLKRIQMDALPR